MVLSKKQIESFGQSDARINIWCGAVRSGKTYSSILKLIYLIQEGPPGNCLIVGVTRESVQTNVINDMCEMLGIPSISAKSNECEILGRRIRILGANDSGSVRKIQGSTLSIAYVDEAAVIPESFFTMLLSRLSKDGATLLATANPEGPYHWLKTKFIDKAQELDLKHFDFELDDNPALPEAYKENIKKEYTGVWYNRMILGQWAVAEGLIYDSFDEQNQLSEKPSNANYYIAGIDYGTTNPTACVVVGVNFNELPKVWVEAEYVYDSKKALRAKADWELANDIEEFLRPYYVKHVYMDPSAASLKVELRRRRLPIRDADNDVIKGIKIVGGMMATKELAICKGCKTLIKELHTYSWDPKAADRGKDSVLKEHDHACFVAGTMIATDSGDVPIEEIQRGDMVLTRKGYRAVTSLMSHRSSDLWELCAGDSTLVGTGDHPIKTSTGDIPLKSCNGYHQVWTVTGMSQWSKKLHLMRSHIDGIQSRIISVIGPILDAIKQWQSVDMGICTEMCGSSTMAKFQKDFRSITLTGTHPTMTKPTWCASQQQTMPSFTRYLRSARDKTAGTSIGSDHLQLNGIEVKRAESGTESTQRDFGKSGRKFAKAVKTAALNTIRCIVEIVGSVVTPVKQRPDVKAVWTTKQESAPCVARRLSRTSTVRQNFVEERAVAWADGKENPTQQNPVPSAKSHSLPGVKKPSFAPRYAQDDTTTVYNIEVEEEHEYFANGVLVSNCDALRYCLATHLPYGLEGRTGKDYSNKAVMERVHGKTNNIQEMLRTY